ncbi:MAG: AMP-binding protein, partial [Ginsengibacter sp.]
MQQPTRLFDCINMHLKESPGKTMLAGKIDGQWKEYSTLEVAEIVNQLSIGLLQAGVGQGDLTVEGRDKIAVIAKNRPEWVILDLAVQQIGALLIPIYPTVSEIDLEFILKDAGVKMIFVNDSDLNEKIRHIKPNLPELHEIISFEKTDGIRLWKELLINPEPNQLTHLKSVSDKIGYEDLTTIIYTSGTTGKPKGVMLSHKNILSNVIDSLPCFPPGDNLTALSFLPLNHIFERMVSFIYLFKGTSIFFAENMETIGENLKEIKPDLFTTVPRVLEKVYEKIMTKGEELTGLKRNLFFWAHGLASKFEI